MWDWILISAVIFVSILVGIALARLLQIIEQGPSWNAPTPPQAANTPHTAPGADWGTWSTTTR